MNKCPARIIVSSLSVFLILGSTDVQAFDKAFSRVHAYPSAVFIQEALIPQDVWTFPVSHAKNVVFSGISASLYPDHRLPLRRYIVDEKLPYVLITEAIDAAALEALLLTKVVNVDIFAPADVGTRFTQEQFLEAGRQANARGTPYSAIYGFPNHDYGVKAPGEFFHAYPKLIAIVLWSTGYDCVNLAECSLRHIQVTNAPGPLSIIVAEHNTGMLLEGIFDHRHTVRNHPEGSANRRLSALGLSDENMALVTWGQTLMRTLRLADMYDFGQSENAFGPGVHPMHTIMHEQMGSIELKNSAGQIILRNQKTLGLVIRDAKDRVGRRLAQIAQAHELHQVLYWVEESEGWFTPQMEGRLGLERARSLGELQERSHPLIRSPHSLTSLAPEREGQIIIDPSKLYAGPAGVDRLLRNWRGKILGMVGLKGIGMPSALRAQALGFNVKALVKNLGKDDRGLKKGSVMDASMKTEFLRQVHALMFAVTLNAETRNWLNAEALKFLKKGALIINTSRGPVLDEEALFERLKADPGMRVRLDVLRDEWATPNKQRLVAHPSVEYSAHTASANPEVRRGMALIGIYDNLLKIFRGEPPVNPLNGPFLDRRIVVHA